MFKNNFNNLAPLFFYLIIYDMMITFREESFEMNLQEDQ